MCACEGMHVRVCMCEDVRVCMCEDVHGGCEGTVCMCGCEGVI